MSRKRVSFIIMSASRSGRFFPGVCIDGPSSMVQVLIVGDHESGKATFLTLLYAAAVKSGSGKADEFRFHAPIESMETASLLFQQLMAGAFPDAVTKQGIHELILQVDSSRSRGGLLSRIRGKEGPSTLSELRFTLLGALDEELPLILKGSVTAIGGWKNILDGDVVTLLVDSTKLAAKVEGSELSPMSEYDASAETLMSAIQHLRQRDDRRLVYPAFAFTKFDRVNPDVLKAAKVGSSPPRVDDRARTTYAEALLGHNMPKSSALIRGRVKEGPGFAKPAYFFSWVRTEGSQPGRADRIRLRRAELSGWEPEYPREEYFAYLGYLENIASRTRA